MELWRINLIIITGFVESLFYSGSLFGWPSLLLMLQEEGVYRDVCPVSSAVTAQKLELYDNRIQLFVEDTKPSRKRPYHYNINKSLQTNRVGPFSSESYEAIAWKESANGTTESRVGDVDCVEHIENCASSFNTSFVQDLPSGCDEQRIQMTLIYTCAAVAYGITAVFIGVSLEYLGLRITRIVGSIFATTGYVLLAYVTPEMPYLLWPALNLIALGTNQLRLSGFQFADLCPKYRATIITAYSSAYSISTTMFVVVQMLYEESISLRLIFLCVGGMCATTLIPTFFMPKMKIQPSDHYGSTSKSDQPVASDRENSVMYMSQGNVFIKNATSNQQNEPKDEIELPPLMVNHQDIEQNQLNYPEQNTKNDERTDPAKQNGQGQDKEPGSGSRKKFAFMSSILSLSGFLHMYWHFINLFLILFYSSTFNIWAGKVTPDLKTVSFYTKISGLCCFIAPLFIPLVGFVTDRLIGRAQRRRNRVERLAYTMQAPAYAMFAATLVLSSTMVCKLFLTETAIYASLVLISLSRPIVVGSCTAYIRLRFPAEQFNILNGVFTTIISILCFVQYPIMKYMTTSSQAYSEVHWMLLMTLIGSLISPLHMMIRKNILYYARARLIGN